MLIQTLFTQSAVEALDVSVLHRFAGPNELRFYAVLVCPGVERLADELRAVIHLNQIGAPSSLPRLLEHTRHANTRQREVDLDVPARPVPHIDDGQHSNAAAMHQRAAGATPLCEAP